FPDTPLFRSGASQAASRSSLAGDCPKSDASSTTPRVAPKATSAASFPRPGMDRPVAQWDTAARVDPVATAISRRLRPACSRRVMALVWLMVTKRNPYPLRSQPRVTAPVGNLLYPLPRIIPMPSSHAVRGGFDIVKAEAIRRRPENQQGNGDPIAYAEIA